MSKPFCPTKAAQLEAVANSSARHVLLKIIRTKAEAHAKKNPQPRAVFLLG